MTDESKRTPFEIAEEWYQVDDIANAIQEGGGNNLGSWDKIPEDVYSLEFAKWLTHQYRLAMAKGVSIGRSGSED